MVVWFGLHGGQLGRMAGCSTTCPPTTDCCLHTPTHPAAPLMLLSPLLAQVVDAPNLPEAEANYMIAADGKCG